VPLAGLNRLLSFSPLLSAPPAAPVGNAVESAAAAGAGVLPAAARLNPASFARSRACTERTTATIAIETIPSDQ
jgi:hypothetical protein